MKQEFSKTFQYEVTQDAYVQLVALQMNLQNSTLVQRVKYWVLNIGYFGCSVVFVCMRPQSVLAWVLCAMGLCVAVIRTYQMVFVEKRALRFVNRYIAEGRLEEGYLGGHELQLYKGDVICRYGAQTRRLAATAFSGSIRLKSCTALLAEGKIFDVIPNRLWDADGMSETVTGYLRLCRNEAAEREILLVRDSFANEEAILEEYSWENGKELYAGLAAGHRLFYTTRAGWKDGQIIRLILLLYGLGVLILGLNLYVGLGFTLLGLFLNRQILLTMTPAAKELAKSNFRSDMEDVQSRLFIGETHLSVWMLGTEIRMNRSQLAAVRKTAHFICLYGTEQQMMVLPRTIWEQSVQLQNICVI